MNRRYIIAAVPALTATLMSAAHSAEQAATALPEQFAATLTSHDIAAFAELFAEDYVNHQASAAAPPPAAGRSAKQNTVDFFHARLIGLPDLQVSIEAMVISGDRAAASFVYEGTHGGPYFGVPPTGRKLRFTSCDIFRVRQGKLVEHWGMGDTAGILAQLRS